GNDNLENTWLFHQLDEYDWDNDLEFQGGLRSILGSVQDPDRVRHLTLRARCYYFSRKVGQQVDFDGYQRWLATRDAVSAPLLNGNGAHETTSQELEGTQADGAAADGGMANAPKPASFAEICDMIAEGKPIPGIKDIPPTILDGQVSESSSSRRKKPWEKD
ncbi:hypothetical protein BAUCODRAFT_51573, partial [Baudoinia panamericana UAMH 10762]